MPPTWARRLENATSSTTMVRRLEASYGITAKVDLEEHPNDKYNYDCGICLQKYIYYDSGEAPNRCAQPHAKLPCGHIFGIAVQTKPTCVTMVESWAKCASRNDKNEFGVIEGLNFGVNKSLGVVCVTSRATFSAIGPVPMASIDEANSGKAIQNAIRAVEMWTATSGGKQTYQNVRL